MTAFRSAHTQLALPSHPEDPAPPVSPASVAQAVFSMSSPWLLGVPAAHASTPSASAPQFGHAVLGLPRGGFPASPVVLPIVLCPSAYATQPEPLTLACICPPFAGPLNPTALELVRSLMAVEEWSVDVSLPWELLL